MIVHREVFTAPIDRVADPLHLIVDRAAVLLFPSPYPLEEFLATHLPAILAFARQLPFDHQLRRNACVVRTWQPQGLGATHAEVPHHDVHLGVVEHVAHVQTARDIWRRKQQREFRLRLIVRRGSFGREELFFDPVLCPARLNCGRVVCCRKIVRHVCLSPERSPIGIRSCRHKYMSAVLHSHETSSVANSEHSHKGRQLETKSKGTLRRVPFQLPTTSYSPFESSSVISATICSL